MSHLPLMLAFLMGLSGGFSHCIGMCGVFVVSYSTVPDTEAKSVYRQNFRHLLFHGGRLVSLTTLGFLAGLAGGIGNNWAHAGAIFSITAGTVLLCLSVGFAGIVPFFHIPEPDLLAAGGGIGRRLFLKALQHKGKFKPLFVGVFVGLLPCGLTYYALIVAAASRHAGNAALTMLLFGLGTIPGLLTLGVFGGVVFGGALLRPRFRRFITQIAAGIMAIMAIAFILRGWQYLD